MSVTGGRRCATCGAKSGLSVTVCWSCGNPLVNGVGTAVLEPAAPAPVQAPAHRIGFMVWAVCLALLSITIFAVFWISRGPESVEFPDTLDGMARTEESPFDEAMRDVYADEGVSLNQATWGTGGDYTAFVVRHPTEGVEQAMASWAASVRSDLTVPIGERSVSGVTIRCYVAGGKPDLAGESRAWCGWIDADELGLLLHRVGGPPPLAQTEQVLRSVKGWA